MVASQAAVAVQLYRTPQNIVYSATPLIGTSSDFVVLWDLLLFTQVDTYVGNVMNGLWEVETLIRKLKSNYVRACAITGINLFYRVGTLGLHSQAGTVWSCILANNHGDRAHSS